MQRKLKLLAILIFRVRNQYYNQYGIRFKTNLSISNSLIYQSSIRMRFLLSGKKNKLKDEEIIRRYKEDHDLSWIGILFDRYSHLAFAVSYNYLKDEEECKDVVVTVFEKIQADLLKYDVRVFHTWLHTVIRNRCLYEISKKIDKDPIDVLNLQTDSEQEDELYNYFSLLEESIRSLSEEQQKCILLFYFEKLSYMEISFKTGYEIKKVKSCIQNGKRNLKLILEKKANEKN